MNDTVGLHWGLRSGSDYDERVILVDADGWWRPTLLHAFTQQQRDAHANANVMYGRSVFTWALKETTFDGGYRVLRSSSRVARGGYDYWRPGPVPLADAPDTDFPPLEPIDFQAIL